MTIKLDEKPGQSNGYDDGKPDWRQPLTGSDDFEDKFNAPSAGDDNLTPGHPDRQNKKSDTPEELANAEAEGKTPSASKAEQAESSDDNQDGGLYHDDGKRDPKKKGRLSHRQKILGGGLTTLVIGGAVGISSILQGPLQIVHFAQLMDRFHFSSNRDFSNSRSNKLLRYLRFANSDRPERRRLGIVLNKYANQIEKRWKTAGFEPEYNGTRNRLNELRIRPDIDIKPFVDDGAKITRDPDGYHRVNFDEVSDKNLRRSMRRVAAAAGHGWSISAVESRVLTRRGSVGWKLFSKQRRAANEKVSDYQAKVRERLRQYYKKGSSALGIRSSPIDGADTDGDKKPDPDPKAQAEADAGNSAADDVADGTRSGGLPEGRSRLKKNVGRGAGLVGVVCIARAVSNHYPAIQYANIVLPLIRIGAGVLSMGSQVQAGKGLNIEELGAVSSRFYAEYDSTGKKDSWVNARSIQAELGKPQTGPDLPPSARPALAGQKPAALSFVDTISSVPGVGFACSSVGGLLLSVVGGPAEVAFDFVIDTVLKATGFDPVDFLTRLIAGEEVDGDPGGPTFGSFGNVGSRLGNNDIAAAGGGEALTNDEEAQLDDEQKLASAEDFRNLALKDRLFSFDTPDSLISQMAVNSPIPQNAADGFARLAAMPATILSSFASIFNGFFGAPANAAGVNNGYDYGFPMFGFSKADRDNPKNDPHAIAEELDSIIKSRTLAEAECERNGHGPHPPYHKCDYVPSNVQEFNDIYEKCFGTRIIEADLNNPNSVESFESLQTVNYFSEESDGGRPNYCETGKPDTEIHLTTSAAEAANDLRVWRFYLADTITGHSMACYEGEEASCKLFDIKSGAAANQ